MKPFLDKNFLLQSATAERLYHDYAANLPIIDYHCHLDPAQIAGNISFTNTHLAEVLNPSLSAVYQPGFDMGKKATEMLIGLIETKRPITEFQKVVLPTELFIRDSSKPVLISK